MASQAGTITLQQYQDFIPVRYNTQESSQRKATQMQMIILQSHEQAPMLHQRKTDNAIQAWIAPEQ